MSETASVTTINPRPRAKLTVEVHDTPAEIFATLARVFNADKGNGTHEWVTLHVDGVTINFHTGMPA